MTDSTVLAFRQPGEIADPLTEILRQGARELLAQAIEAEVCAHLEAHTHLKTDAGLQRIVRHGHGPGREILTGIGPVPVRRAPLVDAVLPILYLRGVSSGDMAEALQALVGADAGSLSAPHISLARSAG